MGAPRDHTTGLTDKQEHFAQAVAAGSTQADAYRLAYNVSPDTSPQTCYVNASQLAAATNVARRIQSIKDAAASFAAQQLGWDQARFLQAAEEHRKLALSGGWRGVSPANGALEMIGRASGVLTEKAVPGGTAIQIVFLSEGQRQASVTAHLPARELVEQAPEVTPALRSPEPAPSIKADGATDAPMG